MIRARRLHLTIPRQVAASRNGFRFSRFFSTFTAQRVAIGAAGPHVTLHFNKPLTQVPPGGLDGYSSPPGGTWAI